MMCIPDGQVPPYLEKTVCKFFVSEDKVFVVYKVKHPVKKKGQE